MGGYHRLFKTLVSIRMMIEAYLSSSIAYNGLCKWSAGLKVMNFQARTEPIRLFNISNFPSSRQRRIGGVAITNCGWITHQNPHYIYILLN